MTGSRWVVIVRRLRTRVPSPVPLGASPAPAPLRPGPSSDTAMLSLACLVLTALPQGEVHGRPSRIVLPDRPARQPAEPQKASATSQDAAFHEAVLQLRRSLLLPPAKEAAIALRIGERFDAVPERCIALLPRLDADQTHGAMVLLRRFGGPEQAKEL